MRKLIYSLAALASFSASAHAGETIYTEDFEAYGEGALPTGNGAEVWQSGGHGREESPGKAEILRDGRLNDSLVVRTTPDGKENSNAATFFNIVREIPPVSEDLTFSVDVTPILGTAQISLFSASSSGPKHLCMIHLKPGRESKAYALERDETNVRLVEIAPIQGLKRYRVKIRLSFTSPEPEWSAKIIDIAEERELGAVEGLRVKVNASHVSHILLGMTHSSEGEALWDNISLSKD